MPCIFARNWASRYQGLRARYCTICWTELVRYRKCNFSECRFLPLQTKIKSKCINLTDSVRLRYTVYVYDTSKLQSAWRRQVWRAQPGGRIPLRRRCAPSRHSGESSLSEKEPSSSLTSRSARSPSGGSQKRMSAHTTRTGACVHSVRLAFSSLRIGNQIMYCIRNANTSHSWEIQYVFTACGFLSSA